MRDLCLLLALSALPGACSSTTQAPTADARSDVADAATETAASATCGTCPATAPICYHVNAHDGSRIERAECVIMPSSCASTPTCACASQAIRDSWSADGGAEPGLPTCPGFGALYCDGSEGPLTIRCNPP